MKTSLLQKLKTLSYRYKELGGMLSDPEIIADQPRYRSLSKEYAELKPVVDCYHYYEKNLEDCRTAKEMMQDADAEMSAMAEEELATLQDAQPELEQTLQTLLLPKDPNDEKNVFLEIRAGTGGQEAAIFSGDLFRMYSRFAEASGWRVEIISHNPGEQGGYKEIIASIAGSGVYSQLKFESGAHRVQRVPTTESQGRVHTSACTVAILPEADTLDEITINPSDLRIDTFRASGAGGQHVNKTDSAIRLTHIPTGVVVECQDERSQHKNKARAMSILQARLTAAEKEKQDSERAQTRRQLVGSGDRSERIRTYNFPQGRVTDHRINLTLYQLEDIMEGNLALVIDPLTRELQADLLAEMSQT